MTATDEYLQHRAAIFGPSAVVLDLGCGDGRFVEMLMDQGLNVIGLDVPDARPSVEARAARRPALNLLSRIRFFDNPERIPLDDDSVDVVVSNTVFEHILTLNSTVSELARVLKPGGHVYTVFPLASAIIEQHCGLPLIHGLESRKCRLRYIQLAKVLGLYRNSASPVAMEHYIYNSVFYRRENEIRLLFQNRFCGVDSDIGEYLRIKSESLIRRGDWRALIGRAVAANLPWLARWIHIRHSAAFRLSEPRKS